MANEKRLVYVDSIKHEQKNILFMGRNAGKMRTMLNDIVTAMIAHCPTVDAVEVVRCKDCKWSEDYLGVILCNYSRGLFGKVTDDDFCSRGERKDNERKAD